MTPTIPSPISDQAAGEPVAKPNYVALARDAGLQLRIDSKFGNPNYQSVSGSWPALVKFAELLSTAPTTGSAPVVAIDEILNNWSIEHKVFLPQEIWEDLTKRLKGVS